MSFRTNLVTQLAHEAIVTPEAQKGQKTKWPSPDDQQINIKLQNNIFFAKSSSRLLEDIT